MTEKPKRPCKKTIGSFGLSYLLFIRAQSGSSSFVLSSSSMYFWLSPSPALMPNCLLIESGIHGPLKSGNEGALKSGKAGALKSGNAGALNSGRLGA